MNQCFVISLPRSGSTLLQRLLAVHPRIQTAGEPWLALPFAYALREKGARAEFSHRSMAQGIGEFVNALPGGAATYYREAGRMMERLHETMARNGRDWFLDKTPRYFLILNELMAMFPEAKFVVLQRNPLAVVASIWNTWHGGRFDFGSNELDVFEGPRAIAEFVSEPRANVCEVSFEQVVAQPVTQLRVITDFLGLEPLADVELPDDDPLKQARLGDKTGVQKFSKVSTAPLESWKEAFASHVRKLWARHYLEWLGEKTLGRLGYDRGALLQELDAIPTAFGKMFPDIMDCRMRLWPLYFGRRLNFVRQERRDTRVRYLWKAQS